MVPRWGDVHNPIWEAQYQSEGRFRHSQAGWKCLDPCYRAEKSSPAAVGEATDGPKVGGDGQGTIWEDPHHVEAGFRCCQAGWKC